MTSLAMEMKKIRYMMLADFRVQMLFRLGLVLQIVNIAIGAGSYYFLTTVFQGKSEVMGRYGTDVVSYILLGMTMNPVLMTSFTGIFRALVMSYSNRSLERIMMTPTSVYTLFFSRMAGGYIASALVASDSVGGRRALWRESREGQSASGVVVAAAWSDQHGCAGDVAGSDLLLHRHRERRRRPGNDVRSHLRQRLHGSDLSGRSPARMARLGVGAAASNACDQERPVDVGGPSVN